MKIYWNAIKTWFLESLEAMSEASVASSMWVDGYSDFEIEEELRNHEKRMHQRSDVESSGVCGSGYSQDSTNTKV